MKNIIYVIILMSFYMSVVTMARSQSVGVGSSTTGSVSSTAGSVGVGSTVSGSGNGSSAATSDSTGANVGASGASGRVGIGGASEGGIGNGSAGSTTFGVIEANDSVPTGAGQVFRGSVVSVNRSSHTINIRDPKTATLITRTVNNDKMLESFHEGDSVQLYSESK